ncbi:TolB-like translocation protein [Mangrovivirga cuniculi]|uniref:PD40 domain-containing protein n=1 Tax=Mangrovivirga cuniculi TaxID=2715131 RepID=UPI00158695CC|nr:PD40 domain-containing protein [Mangrovivirga cuniculi]
MDFLTDNIPEGTPIEFQTYNIPNDFIIHKGIFSPSLDEYYYTISDRQFEQFDVYVQRKQNGQWSEPEKAFFNSEYSEHGMSFAPNGNTLYFSSTRPTKVKGIPETWHIWRSSKVNGKWSTPEFINIPNLANKLVSHPTISNSGTMYFHASNLDYSDMDIYLSKNTDGVFEPAQKASIIADTPSGKCTPYVSPSEDYLIFASIGEDLDLMITFKDGSGKWTNTKKLNENINTKGQGNPYVTPDDKFLFFTVIDDRDDSWKIKWVNIESELENN